MDAAEFSDIELWATTYLRTQLPLRGYTSAYVSNRYVGRDVEVWVRRDGGPTLDRHRELARLSVNVFYKSPTDQPVADLALLVSALLRAARDQVVVGVEQISGPSPIADTLPRRLMSFDITARGASLSSL